MPVSPEAAQVAAAQQPNYFNQLIVLVQDYLRHPVVVGNVKVWPGFDIPDIIVYTVAMLAACGVILGIISVTAMVLIYLERKIAGHIQSRVGPMRVGWHGVLQSVADGLKLFAKEDLVPDNANRFLFSVAPTLVLIGAIAPFAALPFAHNLVIANMDIGLFYILSFASLEVIGVIMAGWASNSKWSLYGGMRLAAQMMSYEIPMGLAALTVVLLAGSLNLNVIASEQSRLPFMLLSPFGFLGFFIFYIGGLASTKRAPFDLPEAESELVSGFHTEYSGMRFSFFFLAEYASMALVSGVAAFVFMGGWNFPLDASNNVIIGLIQLSVKVSGLLFLMLWLRWTLPRVRVDQVMYMCLKVLLPLGLFCVIGAALEAVTGAHLVMWLICFMLGAVVYMISRRAQVRTLSQRT